MTMRIIKALHTHLHMSGSIYLNLIKQLLPPRDPQSSRADELTATVEILYCGKNWNNVVSKLIMQNHQ